MPGTIEQRATLLKAAESIEDDTQREAAINALKASDTAMSGAWQTRGVPGCKRRSKNVPARRGIAQGFGA